MILSLNTAEIVKPSSSVRTDCRPWRADLLLIDMSSTDPKATAAMGARLRSETGMGWVDAPLSGGAPAATEGRLTLMMGGEERDVERAKGVLSAVAANMTHMGPCGAGQTTKLINQVLCACNFLAVAEATPSPWMPASMPSAFRRRRRLAGGRGRQSHPAGIHGQDGEVRPDADRRIDNMLKDLEATQRFSMGLRTPMPLTNLITDLHRMMVAAGIGGEDSAAYMKMFDFGRAAG